MLLRSLADTERLLSTFPSKNPNAPVALATPLIPVMVILTRLALVTFGKVTLISVLVAPRDAGT